jgi:uncharacterized membrane protein YbaN (DUF454 family)
MPTDAPQDIQRRESPAEAEDGLGEPVPVPQGGRRDRVRSKPGVGHAYRIGVFIVGLLMIALGIGLAVLPGPLTIPPVLLGLWIWSTEFRFAERFFDSFKRKGQAAWAHAKAHPTSAGAVTVGGLAAAGIAIWAVTHYQLIDKAKDALS